MTKLIILALLVSTSLYAQDNNLDNTLKDPGKYDQEMIKAQEPVMNGNSMDTPALITEDLSKIKKFNPRESHWISTLGFEAMKYPVPYKFDGARSDFNPKDQEIFGGRLGLGGEWYIGKGIVTATRVEGYYMGTLFSQILNGGPDSEDVNFAYTKRTSQIYGVDASQQLGFMFEMKTKNPIMNEWSYLMVEPYVEAGLGAAKVYNRLNYQYDTGTAPTAAREKYKDTINDTLTNARIGGGINFTSSEGFFLYMRVTVNKYNITKREQDKYSQPSGQAATKTTNNNEPNLDPITVYAIGGGYKF